MTTQPSSQPPIPQVLGLCFVLGKCLRGIALVLYPLTPVTIPTQPNKYCIIQIGLRIHINDYPAQLPTTHHQGLNELGFENQIQFQYII